jgi:hypothetical protein
MGFSEMFNNAVQDAGSYVQYKKQDDLDQAAIQGAQLQNEQRVLQNQQLQRAQVEADTAAANKKRIGEFISGQMQNDSDQVQTPEEIATIFNSAAMSSAANGDFTSMEEFSKLAAGKQKEAGLLYTSDAADETV